MVNLLNRNVGRETCRRWTAGLIGDPDRDHMDSSTDGLVEIGHVGRRETIIQRISQADREGRIGVDLERRLIVGREPPRYFTRTWNLESDTVDVNSARLVVPED